MYDLPLGRSRILPAEWSSGCLVDDMASLDGLEHRSLYRGTWFTSEGVNAELRVTPSSSTVLN